MTLEECLNAPSDLFLVSKSRGTTNEILSRIMDNSKNVKTEIFSFRDFSNTENTDTKIVVLTNYEQSLSYTTPSKLNTARVANVKVVLISEVMDSSVMPLFRSHLLCKVEDASEALYVKGSYVEKIQLY